jgi:tetratricopeptide (TPR) repeat protein
MSDNSRALVPLGQRGVVVSITRQITITEKLLTRIQAAALKTVQTPPEWNKDAYEFHLKEDWPGLLNHSLRWTQAQPENADAWCFLGIAYMQSDQLAKAIEASQQAICIKPEDADLWCSLGIFYKVSGQTAKAIEAYQQAIRIKPEDANAWYRLGIAYNSSGQASQIIEVHKSLKSLDPAMADEFLISLSRPDKAVRGDVNEHSKNGY